MAKQTSVPTYQTLLNQASAQLFDHSDSPRIDAEVLLQHVVDGSMAWLIAHGDSFATAEHITAFTSIVDQRQLGLPIAYLVGHKEFWSLQLKVNKHVLVPRADTETLVEHALDLLAGTDSPAILDLGTGSGAIALALAKELPQSAVIAVDASIDALRVAQENAETNTLENVTLTLSNWYSALGDNKFDLIAANPPYVAEGDPHLGKGDLKFEPSVALVAKENGYADLQIVIENAPRFLKAGATLIVEHGFQQGTEVGAIFKKTGFSNIQTHHDLNGLPRCTSGSFRA